MNQPLVSVIIPLYNASKYITATIDSILNQTYKNIELLIINDGSKDESEEIIKNFTDTRLRYYYQENKGTCAATNLGIAHAKGKYIKFFDADDLMNTQHIEAQLSILNGSNSAIASCAWGRFYDGNPASAIFNEELVWRDMESLQWLRESLMQRTDMMPAWLWLIPKNILDKAGGFNEQLTLNNDFEFSVRLLLQVDKVFFTRNAKVYYRSGMAESLSVCVSENAYIKAYYANVLGCSYLLQADNSVTMKRLCANRYQEWIFRMYPNYPTVAKLFQEQIDKLGGSNIKPEGGIFLRLLSNVFGWKNARNLKRVLYNLLKK